MNNLLGKSWHTVAQAGLVWPSLLVLTGGLLLGVSLMADFADWVRWLAALTALASVAVALSWASARIYQCTVQPVQDLRAWAQVAEQGVGKHRAKVAVSGEFALLAEDLNELIEIYCRQKDADDRRLKKEIKRLARKTSSLNILYDVAARISSFDSMDELIRRSLETIKRMTGALAVAIDLDEDDELQLAGMLDEANHHHGGTQLRQVRLCLCGKALTTDHLTCDDPAQHCSKMQDTPVHRSAAVRTLAISLGRDDQAPGQLRVFLPLREQEVSGLETSDMVELLRSIADHLGVAISKAQLSRQGQRVKLLEARQRMAGDLHDSVAQSLNSIRFQLTSLSGRLNVGDTQASLQAVERIAGAVDEANRELRELLQRLREPAPELGLRTELKGLIDRFRRETGLKVFFQVQCRGMELIPDEELQVLRIVQESLANVRKHANARMVRVMLGSGGAEGPCRILIEDDGEGFDESVLRGHMGGHIGLSLMEERAQRIGANLSIESEPGEGTQVRIQFQPNKTAQDGNVQG